MQNRVTRCLRVAVLVLVSLAAAAEPAKAAENLIEAAQEQDAEAVRELLRAGVDANTRRADGVTALHWAAHWGDSETAEALLRAGADVDVAEGRGVTPLLLACELGAESMVARLLAAGANPNTPQGNGITPLMKAARTGEMGVVNALLTAGADPKALIPSTKQTALTWATAQGHHDAMRALIAAGSDVRSPSALGFTPLMFAARNGDIDAARMLIAAGATVNDVGSDGTHPLPLALVSGRAEFAHFLIEQGADPNGEIQGVRALHVAVGSVDDWIRDWIRARKQTIYFGATQSVASSDRPALVEALLAAGADVNARIPTFTIVGGVGISGKYGAREVFATGTGSAKGATALWIAAFNAGRTAFRFVVEDDGVAGGDASQLIRMLLDAGADPQLRTADDTTALMVAAGLGMSNRMPDAERGLVSPAAETAVKMLVEAGVDVNAVNEAGFTALHGAAFRGTDEVVKYLVEKGANINAQDFRGRTPLFIARGPTQQGFFNQSWPETAELFEQLGANTTLGVDRMTAAVKALGPAGGPASHEKP